jgi:Holliday junction DNA helicase RuvB
MINPDLVAPKNLDEIVGMEDIREIVRYEITGSKKLNEPISHWIISGSAGTGKSMIARLIATMIHGNVFRYLAADLKNQDNVYELATQLKDNDVVFLEEAHGLNKRVETTLLTWLEENKLLGGGQWGVVNAPKVCFIFPTTHENDLSAPLRSRCKILRTSYYTNDQIKEIIKRASQKLEMKINDDDALTLLAQSSRGTPRTAIINRLDPLRKIMAVDNLKFNKETVEKFFKIHNIDPYGLESHDKLYCDALYNKMNESGGRPVSLKVLAQTTGLSIGIVEHIVEPYLHQIDVIRIDTRGRSFTNTGYDILGFSPIIPEKVSLGVYNAIEIDRAALKVLIDNEDIRREGMRGIAKHMGLRYPQDNFRIQSALADLGYVSKQRVGIVKL